MDKDKSSDIPGPCSWMEMHQFIGDLITSGNASKDQTDVLNAAWGLSGPGGVTLGFKAASLEPLQHPPPPHPPPPAVVGQDKTADLGRHVQIQRRGQTRDRREDVHHACTCPGCPYSSSSSSPPSFETLKPRQPASLPGRSQPKDLSSSAPMSLSICVPDTTASQMATTSGRLQRESADRGTRSPGQNSEVPPSRQALSGLSMFPCLCCHRSLQTCAQLLSHQEGSDSPFSHTHAHHHFHHHHCPIASCFPSGAFPCFTCSQICHHQHRQTQPPPPPPPPEERARSQSSAFLSMYPCMHCPASFTRPSQLLQHQRSDHTQKAPGFICTECGRTFNSHSNLRIHLNVHTGARPYICSDCGKSFSQSGALKIHKRIHTGERPYSCAFCGRGFPHLAGLRAHQRTHTGEKPYHCNQCGKCFTQSGALKIHTRIHTGERPFICSICGKGFSNRSGIRFHYRTVHGLLSENNNEAGGAAYRGPAAAAAAAAGAGRGFPPRTFPQATINLNAPNSPDGDSHSAHASGENPASASEAGNSGGDGEALLYACEDCGLRFKDAPSRNRHQTVVHYSSEGREEEEEEEEEVEREKHK